MPHSGSQRFSGSKPYRGIITLLLLTSVAVGARLFVSETLPSQPTRVVRNQETTASGRNHTPSDPVTAASTESFSIDSLEAAGAHDTHRVISLANNLAASDPVNAREIGYALITALQRVGSFEEAASYAATSLPANRRDLIIAAFHEWGRQRPDAAFTASIRLTDPVARDFATQSVLSGWARTNPAELAETALQFPEGPEKTAALTKALRSWMIKDPNAAGDWILSHDVAVPIAEKFFARDER